MCSLNLLLIISSVIVQAKCVGERENGFERKRFDIGLETCIENFDVHADKIIRTQDSRAMGAKYLNEADVNSRDECTKLCCETPTCDVFVFEQKVPGSCYLFHCGSPEDFKCKFTQHRNYTSAVLALNNRLSELENRMKLTKHEEELNMLRKMDLQLDTTTFLPLSTKVPAISAQPKQNTTKSQCSRYQFECRGSGECIAIYNACDGIPQCADGSDEAPELYCITGVWPQEPSRGYPRRLKSEHQRKSGKVRPKSHISDSNHRFKNHGGKAQAPGGGIIERNISRQRYAVYKIYREQNDKSTSHPKTFHEQLKNLKEKNENSPQIEKIPKVLASPEPLQKVQLPLSKSSAPSRQHESASPLGYFPYGYSQQNDQTAGASRSRVDQPSQLPNQPRYYGREGEMVQYPINNAQWQGYQPQSQEERNHFFGRKGNGLIPDTSDSQFPAPYNNELNHAEYLKYAAAAVNNGYYSGSGPMFYPWPQRIPQQLHGLEDVPQRPLLTMYGNGMSGSAPSDYFYEDSQVRGRFPLAPQNPRTLQNSENQQQNNLIKHPEKQETLQEYAKVEAPKKNESVKKALENVSTTSVKTSAKLETTTESLKEQKSVRGVAEKLKMNEGEVDGVNERPSGAILSLTLGMCITAIMITLVGCRLRVVRKRMRRNSKSPYAHDADFLVNGMYL